MAKSELPCIPAPVDPDDRVPGYAPHFVANDGSLGFERVFNARFLEGVEFNAFGQSRDYDVGIYGGTLLDFLRAESLEVFELGAGFVGDVEIEIASELEDCC